MCLYVPILSYMYKHINIYKYKHEYACSLTLTHEVINVPIWPNSLVKLITPLAALLYLYKYILIYMCLYIYIYECMCLCVYTCIYICIHIYSPVETVIIQASEYDVLSFIQIHIYICIYIYIYIYICIYI
jgi:hypothetical protein